jgi:3-deoxy-manno-octulosonate cytidylyltransferase (CMP-KDO synthetase)
MDFIIVIPARYGSSRLHAKLLSQIHSKPLIQHTYGNALKSKASRVIIATDDERIFSVAKKFGAEVCMTKESHTSGTSRIAEALEKLGIDNDHIVVNLQGDEPMIGPEVINQVSKNLINSGMEVSTLCENINSQNQYLDPNCVKVVFNKFGKALYFSRSPIPNFRSDSDFDINLCYKHIGIYAYKAKFIKEFLTMQSSPLEQSEKLEQLTMLDEGFEIHVSAACAPTGFGVDTQEDLDNVIKSLAK